MRGAGVSSDLSGQHVGLDERVDGGQAAVLVAGPPGADSVPLVLHG